jgi:hypothetical protein
LGASNKSCKWNERATHRSSCTFGIQDSERAGETGRTLDSGIKPSVSRR